jgi:hypothetical protein|tara:strand:- start:629 stop:871 length:243 start_codon:yes stop_codon:yes gene_type:complete
LRIVGAFSLAFGFRAALLAQLFTYARLESVATLHLGDISYCGSFAIKGAQFAAHELHCHLCSRTGVLASHRSTVVEDTGW